MPPESKPWYQHVLGVVAAVAGGFLVLGAVLDSVGNAFNLITPTKTYVGTALLLSSAALTHLCLRRKPLRWVVKGNQPVRLTGFGPKVLCGIAGAVLLLWLPRLSDSKHQDPPLRVSGPARPDASESGDTAVPVSVSASESGVADSGTTAAIGTRPKTGAHLNLFAYTEYEEGSMLGEPNRLNLLSMGLWESYAGVVLDSKEWTDQVDSIVRSGGLGLLQDRNHAYDLYDPRAEEQCKFAGLILERGHGLLPGFLAFVLQNVGGRRGPTITIKDIWVHADIAPSQTPVKGEGLVVSRLEYHPGATSPSLIPTTGRVFIKPGRSIHPVVPSVELDETSGLRPLFRERLAPGEEAFWAILVDAPPRTAFVLKMDLRVEYFVVGEQSTERYTATFPDVLTKPVVRPVLSQIAGVCYIGDRPWIGRPELTASEVWGENWKPTPKVNP